MKLLNIAALQQARKYVVWLIFLNIFTLNDPNKAAETGPKLQDSNTQEDNKNKPFPWNVYFSSVVKNFATNGVAVIEKDLSEDFSTINLDMVFKIMRHFSIQDAYAKQLYSADLSTRIDAMNQASFYTKLILLGRGLVHLAEAELKNTEVVLKKWLSHHNANDSDNIAKNLENLSIHADEFLAKAFLQPAPTDFSSAVERSFEWCETLLDRISVIREFNKQTQTPDTDVITTNNFSLRCTILSTFERFCMLLFTYRNDIDKLTPEDFSDFLGSCLHLISQIISSEAVHSLDPSLKVSAVSSSCLDFLISKAWLGYSDQTKAPTVESDPAASKLVSVKNFLLKLRDKTASAKESLLADGISNDDIAKKYNPLFLFMPDDKVASSQNSPTSLKKLLQVLNNINVITTEDADAILDNQPKTSPN